MTNLGKILIESMDRHSGRTALRYKKETEWQSMTYSRLKAHVHTLAAAMVNAGIRPGDRVGIYSANRYEWAVTDFACILAGAVSVPIYSTNTREQSAFIVKDAGIGLVFTGNRFQYDNMAALSGGGLKIVTYEREDSAPEDPRRIYFYDFMETGLSRELREEVTARHAGLTAGQTLTIIYTSGTTGNPKGVMLSHANALHQFKALEAHFTVTSKDVSLCFLPLSHVYERLWSYFLYSKGALNTYLEDPKKVIETLKEVRPTAMVSVPRLYEKIYAAVRNSQENASPLKKALFDAAVAAGWQYHTKKQEGSPVSLLLSLKFRILDRLVLSKVRDAVGGPKNFFSAGGAPLEKSIEEFFFACGLLICQGYGMTETAPMITFNAPGAFKFGTVGKPVPGCEVRLGDQGEILVKGGQVMQGYYNNPEKTAETIVNGWLKTGDIGEFDEEGYLRITDRIKELIITSGGKNIAPQHIETHVGKDYFIEQIVAVGDRQKFISALVVPAMDALETWAKKQKIKWNSIEELISLPEVLDFYRKRIDLNSGELARFETIKKFILLPRPFTVEQGEITPTLKFRRKVISQKYFDLIEAMYTRATA
ncbi:MAG: long-chain fatty acid--CoA ligase [Desulfobacter sp.]|nr:MAG: long-chain fatty acid--CoA ligase [Desulfobacter sp.]